MKQNWFALLLGAATLAIATTAMAGPGLPIRYATDSMPEKYLNTGPVGGWTLEKPTAWRPGHRVLLVKKTIVTEERILLRPGEPIAALRHHPRHHHRDGRLLPVGERHHKRCGHIHHKAHLSAVGERITRVEITKTILEPTGEHTVMRMSRDGGRWGLKPVRERW
jgi:hypothetical protein